MSRLADRLRKSKGIPNVPPPPNGYQSPPPTDMTAEQQTEYNQIYEDYNQSLSDEYDLNQEKARAYEKQQKAIEANNPHLLEAEMRASPSPKGLYTMNLFGRPIDLASLENYVLNKISPKTIVTKMRYDNSVMFEKMKGYEQKRRKPLPWTLILIILGAVGIVGTTAILAMSGVDIGNALAGFFGGQ